MRLRRATEKSLAGRSLDGPGLQSKGKRSLVRHARAARAARIAKFRGVRSLTSIGSAASTHASNFLCQFEVECGSGTSM